VNKYKKSMYNDIGVKLGLPVTGVIPEDEAIIKSRDARKPLMILKPGSKAAKALLDIAKKISGIPEKKSFFSRLLR
jgi:septum formation inhibitor-activating ATPase MinD